MAIGAVRPGHRVSSTSSFSPAGRSGVDLSTNLQCVSNNLLGAEKTFQQSRSSIVCTLGQVQDTPAGCSKSPDFSPARPRQLFHPPALSLPRQPLHPETRRSAGKAAASYHVLRGGWDDPNCARCSHPPTHWHAETCHLPGRGPSGFPHFALRGAARLSFTARIGRAPFYRARSASTKDGLAAPLTPSETAHWASIGIHRAIPPPAGGLLSASYKLRAFLPGPQPSSRNHPIHTLDGFQHLIEMLGA